MKVSSSLKKQLLKTNKLTFELLESGDIYKISYDDYQINLLNGNLLDGQTANIYLRIKDSKPYQYLPLIGIKANSRFKLEKNKAIYQGKVFDMRYQVTLTVLNDRWYYDVLVEPSKTINTYDLVYGQDVGIAHTGSIMSSEAYTAQYTDHSVYTGDFGYAIQSRQNQGDPQFLQLGGLGQITNYATDGFQVFGRTYKVDTKMVGLEDDLVNQKYQYEFPYLSLQSENLSGNKQNVFTFYGYYEPSRPEILRQMLKVQHNHQAVYKFIDFESNKFQGFAYDVLQPAPLPKKYIQQNYKNRRHLEKDEKGDILSFFTDNHVHVVTRKKESLVERQHGHLLISGDLLAGEDKTFASTNWMYGVFSSHVVLGNTNIQKLTGDVRNPLNIHRISGLRMFVEMAGRYQLLATPNLYEMGVNYARWIYQLEDDQIIVTAHVKLKDYVHRVSFKSLTGKTYNVIAMNQLVFGDHEYQRDFNIAIDGQEAILTADNNAFVKEKYPNLKYKFVVSDGITFGKDDVLFGEEKGHGILSFKVDNKESFTIDIVATYDEFKAYQLDLKIDQQAYKSFINNLTGYQFKHRKQQKPLNQLEDTLYWYTHNALVHYASPHGLEQANGAAWGTRDVLQGPVELFFAANRLDLIRDIILKVFSRQFSENYDFPQWFMFDQYYAIQAHESHGDIIAWPLKVLADYLAATEDLSILDEKVPFMSMTKNVWENHDATLKQHVEKTLNAIQNSFVKGTSLPAYGGGDWDDTLQPANQKLIDHMVSGWTPILLYQGLDGLSKALEGTPLGIRANTLKTRIKNDYEKHMMADDVPAGFVVFEKDHVDYLLHPRDKNTGLKLRLLPLTRSIIAEFIDSHQANYHNTLIEQHLKHPDGVRLMDTFVTYKGGEKTYFQRGETAANVGREIGILYVHAHIRYIEAMAKLGRADEAFEALFTINPILIKNHVNNAGLRQANTYFSSSDAAFLDRYEAKENFNLVKSGQVEVKAGWRLYSSGPGIYIHQMISHVFGIRYTHNRLILDPVLPDKLKGVEVLVRQFNKNIRIKYSYKDHVSGVKINGKLRPGFVRKLANNIYRPGGVEIYLTAFDNLGENILIELI